MEGHKANYKVAVIMDHYGQAAHQIFFETKPAAAKAKKLILAAKLKYDEDRPNAPENRFFTIAHDLGEMTFKIEHVLAVHMFHTAEGMASDIKANEKANDRAAKRQAEILAVAVREAVAEGNKRK